VATIAEVLDIDLSDIDCRTQDEYRNNVKKLPTSPKDVQWKDEKADESCNMSLTARYLRKFLRLIKP
jgi:hypothetical protein